MGNVTLAVQLAILLGTELQKILLAINTAHASGADITDAQLAEMSSTVGSDIEKLKAAAGG